MLLLKKWPSINSIFYTFAYAWCATVALTLQILPLNTDNSFGVIFIFSMGPLFIILDMKSTRQRTRRAHHLETILRVGVMSLVYLYVLPKTIPTPGPFYLVSHLFILTLLYLELWFGLMAFEIRPSHWLRYEKWFNIVFLTMCCLFIVMELGVIKSTEDFGFWGIASVCLGLQIVWRYALWYNAQESMSIDQNKDVWSTLAKRSTPHAFWEKNHYYFQRNGHAMVLSSLSVLPLPTLLAYFHYRYSSKDSNSEFCIDYPDYPQEFEMHIQKAINDKEPRAVFVWQLYPAKEAAAHIGEIDTFTVRSEETYLDLPIL